MESPKCSYSGMHEATICRHVSGRVGSMAELSLAHESRMDTHGDATVRPGPDRPRPHCLAVQLVVRKASVPFLKGGTCLYPGEVGAQAEMDAVAECEMARELPGDIETLRVEEFTLIVVG